MAELVTDGSPRRRNGRSTVRISAVVLILAGLAVMGVYLASSGGSTASASGKDEPPASVEPIGKTGLNRVVLSPSAAMRLDVKTAPVSSRIVNGKRRTAIPYPAVLYDPNGETWTYTRTKALTFVRHDIDVDFITGELAVLSRGPRLGTPVVTVGATELWGVEYGGIEED